MTDKPFLAYQHEVQAILNGTQNQFRRVVKPQPTKPEMKIATLGDTTDRAKRKHIGKHQWVVWQNRSIIDEDGQYFSCPFGYNGDYLWVRETWAIDQEFDSVKPSDIPSNYLGGVYYKATGDKPVGKWRPSIFMPRWASRITLQVKSVRAERLQEITLADAIMEGCPKDKLDGLTPLDWFEELWDSINAKRGCSWGSDPFVWVVEFERV